MNKDCEYYRKGKVKNMVKDVYELIKDNLDSHGRISEERIIHLIGIYGLTRLNDANLINVYESGHGVRVYSLKDI